jgi:hypothetical protein
MTCGAQTEAQMSFGGGGRANGFSPSLLQSFDPLGLPTNLGLLTEEEREERTAQTLRLAEVAHANLVRDFGEKRAQAEWRKLARRRPGRRRKAEQDQLLLAEYDSLVAGKTAEEIKSAPRTVAGIVKRKRAKLFHATIQSVERRLRRALAARDRARAAKAEADRRMFSMIAGVDLPDWPIPVSG